MSQELKSKSPEQALAALMHLTAKAERSSGDAMRLMRRWGLSDSDSRKVLERLVRERFIDDSRYAEAFANDKVRFSGWGTYKIRAALRAKGISAELINAALARTDAVSDTERLAEILRSKAQRTPHKNLADLKAKVVRFGASRGLELDKVIEVTEKILGE